MISVTRGIAATATFRNAFSSAVGVMTIDYRRDYYAGEWPTSIFRQHNITYEPAKLTKCEV